MELAAKELSHYLRGVYSSASRLDKLKIGYRPYICPFGSLIDACENAGSIMDIGCGSGQFLLLLAKYTKAKKIGGIEISSSLVKNANQLLGTQSKADFRIEQFDGVSIPHFIGEFEMVTLVDVFHHIPKKAQESFIQELYNKMKPGAKLIFKDISASHLYVYANKLHDMLLGGGMGKEISPTKAKQLLQDKGFEILSMKRKTMLWYPHYTIICKK